MGFYARFVLPRLVELAMKNKAAGKERLRFVPLASGVVLEIGVGSGLNIPIYGPAVQKLYALDPSPELLRMARPRAKHASFPVELLEQSAEAIPLADESVDTAVTTWTLCSIPDTPRALREIRRVLRRDGRLIFIEHGRSTDPGVVRWQDRLTPWWRRISGGCHLNRPIDRLLAEGGFQVAEMERGYGVGPRTTSYLYRGIARPAGHAPRDSR